MSASRGAAASISVGISMTAGVQTHQAMGGVALRIQARGLGVTMAGVQMLSGLGLLDRVAHGMLCWPGQLCQGTSSSDANVARACRAFRRRLQQRRAVRVDEQGADSCLKA